MASPLYNSDLPNYSLFQCNLLKYRARSDSESSLITYYLLSSRQKSFSTEPESIIWSPLLISLV
uniref:Uncharacterized protein n=1 Tax=virus sp. ctML55 TaxID=2827627 RepID=A0A8S5RJ03_9VIRU|nr:MAG TPA: hypothetical protein [virus sp. ctML55]